MASSSSSSPLFSPIDAGSEVPPFPDHVLPKSPYGLKSTSQTRSGGNGIRTPPLLTLDSGPSPSLRPVLRYSRRAYNSGTRPGIAALRRHARTPSGNPYLPAPRPPPESAPTSAVTSPVLHAQEGGNRACDNALRSRKRNRRSLPLGLAGLSTSPFPTCPMIRAVQPSISKEHAHGLPTMPSHQRMCAASPSHILGSSVLYHRLHHHDHEGSDLLRDATPTNLALRLEALVLERSNHPRPNDSSLSANGDALSKTDDTGLSAAESSSIDASSSLVSDLDLSPSENNERGRSPRDVRVDASTTAHWHLPAFSSSRSRTRSKSIRRQRSRSRRLRDVHPITPLELGESPVRGRQALRVPSPRSPGRRSQTTRPSSAVDKPFMRGPRGLLSPGEWGAAGGGPKMRRRTEGRPQEYRDRGGDRERALSAWLADRKTDVLGSSDDERPRGRSKIR